MSDNIIGKKIKMLRTDSGMKQSELAEKIGMSQQVISSWESGRSEPSYSNLKDISKVLDIDLSILLDGVDYQVHDYLVEYYNPNNRSGFTKIVQDIENLSTEGLETLQTVIKYILLSRKGDD